MATAVACLPMNFYGNKCLRDGLLRQQRTSRPGRSQQSSPWLFNCTVRYYYYSTPAYCSTSIVFPRKINYCPELISYCPEQPTYHAHESSHEDHADGKCSTMRLRAICSGLGYNILLLQFAIAIYCNNAIGVPMQP